MKRNWIKMSIQFLSLIGRISGVTCRDHIGQYSPGKPCQPHRKFCQVPLAQRVVLGQLWGRRAGPGMSTCRFRGSAIQRMCKRQEGDGRKTLTG